MKKLFSLLVMTLAMASAFASVDTILLDENGSYTSLSPAKVLHVRAISSVPTGTATVKAVSVMPVIGDVETYDYATNFTYTVVYTNDTGSVTNTTDYIPLPLGETVTSYVTNSIVTVTTNVTRDATSVVTVTNDLCQTITCAAGYGSEDPEDATFIAPGERIFFEGTAKGLITIFVER